MGHLVLDGCTPWSSQCPINGSLSLSSWKEILTKASLRSLLSGRDVAINIGVGMS